LISRLVAFSDGRKRLLLGRGDSFMGAMIKKFSRFEVPAHSCVASVPPTAEAIVTNFGGHYQGEGLL
jgi:hypothetical protein